MTVDRLSSGGALQRVGTGAAVLRQRLSDVAGVSLRDILAADPRLRLTSSPLRQMLRSVAAPASAEEREAWVWQLAAGMARYTTKQFQYIDLRREAAPLQELYRCFVEEFADGWGALPAMHAVLSQHHDRLASWVAEQLDAVGALRLVRDTGFRPVCAYYSPDLQLQVLGLSGRQLMSPVLDVGCGDGRLVRHLRAMGYDATGIDRDAPPDMLRGDWFDAPLEVMRWGSIIAHQSVSLHFRNAHLQSEERAAEYARLFVRILEALRPGGCFTYAPSVPMFEAVLPRRFGQEHLEVDRGVLATRLLRRW